MDISQDKTEMGIFVCSFCAEGDSFFEYLDTHYQLHVHYSLMVLMNTRLIGFQSYVSWVPISQMGVLKVGVLNVGSKHCAPGRSWEL